MCKLGTRGTLLICVESDVKMYFSSEMYYLFTLRYCLNYFLPWSLIFCSMPSLLVNFVVVFYCIALLLLAACNKGCLVFVGCL